MYVANNQWHKGYYITTCRPTMCQGLKASWTVLHKEITESGSSDNSNSRLYKAPTPQTYQHSSFLQAVCPTCCGTNSGQSTEGIKPGLLTHSAIISEHNMPACTRHASADCRCWCLALHAVHAGWFLAFDDHGGSLLSSQTVHRITAVKTEHSGHQFIIKHQQILQDIQKQSEHFKHSSSNETNK